MVEGTEFCLGPEGPGGRVWGERKRSVAPGPGLCFLVNLCPRGCDLHKLFSVIFHPLRWDRKARVG